MGIRERISASLEEELRREYGGSEVKVVDAGDLDYGAFVLNYMECNQPVLIQGCTQEWRALRDWVDADGSVCVQELRRECPDVSVCVSDTTRSTVLNGKSVDMSVHEYLEWWERRRGTDSEMLYLKDWHCAQLMKDNPFYSVPIYFHDDWLSPFYESLKDKPCEEQNACTSDYRFVYLGPRGSWTPVHADVLRSYSWSANVTGFKRWKLLPPELTYLLYDRTGLRIAPDFELQGIEGIQSSEFLNLDLAAELAFEVHQGPGDCLFVSSGWHHVVHNLTDVLSINENWINAFNVNWTWELIKQTYLHAQNQLSDLRGHCDAVEFDRLSQRVVEADCGMGFERFFQFLRFAPSCFSKEQSLNDLGVDSVSKESQNGFQAKKMEYMKAVVKDILHFTDELTALRSSGLDEQKEQILWVWQPALEETCSHLESLSCRLPETNSINLT